MVRSYEHNEKSNNDISKQAKYEYICTHNTDVIMGAITS